MCVIEACVPASASSSLTSPPTATSCPLLRFRSELGIDAARAFYQRLLGLPAPGGEFFRCAIELEQAEEAAAAAASRGAKGPGKTRQAAGAEPGTVRRLFEAAVASYGAEDPEIWLLYAQHEARALRGAGNIYWRATKALADPDPFVLSYRQQVAAA